MSRRLYCLFSSVDDCKKCVDELLLKRISIKHMHVIAKEGTDLDNLPEASMLQKNDIKHSLIIGLVIGAIIGVGAGIAYHLASDTPFSELLAMTTVAGAIIGAWAASMIGMTTPNVDLKPFDEHIDQGKLLLIVDVPKGQVKDIQQLLQKFHPEAKFKGVEPTKPLFP